MNKTQLYNRFRSLQTDQALTDLINTGIELKQLSGDNWIKADQRPELPIKCIALFDNNLNFNAIGIF